MVEGTIKIVGFKAHKDGKFDLFMEDERGQPMALIGAFISRTEVAKLPPFMDRAHTVGLGGADVTLTLSCDHFKVD